MKRLLILVIAALPLCLWAQRGRSHDTYTPAPDEQRETSHQERGYYDNTRKERKKKETKILTGFSGGLMIHGGYAFSKSPDELFRNGSLMDIKIKDLPKDGATLGIGGIMRLHLLNHIHLGAEANLSYMPLMKSGSNIQSFWAGGFCDFYANLGIVRPLIGVGIGGGNTRRTYIPQDYEIVHGNENATYNASFVKTPFFYMDPYVGIEIGVGHSAILLRVDYMLPFGKSNSGLVINTQWSSFISPSGPRLYVGWIFGSR